MKRFAAFSSLLTFVLAFLLSCEKETILMIDPPALSYNDEGGTQTVTLTANKPWMVISNKDWCTVSPSAGEDADGSRITISCEANTTYDARSSTVTVKCAELLKEVEILQAAKIGLFVNDNDYEVSSKGGVIDLNVLTNVQFDVQIPDAAKEWIEILPSSRGLETRRVSLAVKANPLYVDRSADLKIVEIETHQECPIHINQLQLDTVLIENPIDKGTAHDTTVTVKVRSNVDFSISMCEWMKPERERFSREEAERGEDGLVPLDIRVEVSYNDTYKDRKGTLLFFAYDKAPSVEYQYEQSRYGYFVFDGYCYKTAKYGGSTWMVENLRSNFGQNEGNSLDNWGSPKKDRYTYFWIEGEWGLLYSLDGLLYSPSLQGKNICPEGWHISTVEDWDTVFSKTSDDLPGPFVLDNLGGTDEFAFGANYGEWHVSSFWFNLEFGQPFSQWVAITDQATQVFHAATTYGPYPAWNFRYLRCVKGPIAPELQTLPVKEITTTTAVLRAEVMNDPASSIAKPYRIINSNTSRIIRAGFKYGPSKEELTSVVYSNSTDVIAEVRSLNPGTRYYYQSFVEYEGGDAPVYGSTMAFKTFDDILVYQGHNYYTTIFDGVEFMAQNLQAEKLNDGTTILYIKEDKEWASTTKPAQCVRIDNEDLIDVYGRLYNQYAVESNKICPEGWRLPYHYELVKSREQLYTLFGVSSGVYCLPDDAYWANPTYCNNLSGLSVLPSEMRNTEGAYTETGFNGGAKGFSAYYWAINNTYSPMMDIIQITAQIGQDDNAVSWRETGLYWNMNPHMGCAIRCVKDRQTGAGVKYSSR